ncbi:hypothetical protein CDAR_47501 [Caerostris darwini]|uniref:Uncharacterized protein n=1 Tax=Caerostris darwini TaxID=1538125 RepID=A0AAV4MA31_9ARAC|nr:hypothetical protein CDAR_47501 [Caerostris darwini]
METNPGDGWLSSRFRGLGRAQLRAIMTRVRDTNSPRNLRSNNVPFLPQISLDCVLRWMALAKLLPPCESQFHEPILAAIFDDGNYLNNYYSTEPFEIVKC